MPIPTVEGTRPRSSKTSTPSLPAQLAELDSMNVAQLAKRYLELYGEPTRTRNKPYLQKRLAWRLQELAHGGLSQSAISRITQLGDGLPERWRIRQARQAEAAAQAEPPAHAAHARPVAEGTWIAGRSAGPTGAISGRSGRIGLR